MSKTPSESEYAMCPVCGYKRRVHSSRKDPTCQSCRSVLKYQLRGEKWMARGACTQEVHHPNWWTGDEHFVGLALHVCRTQCPVRAQCLQWAMDNDERDNIYGGLTPAMRARRAQQSKVVV